MTIDEIELERDELLGDPSGFIRVRRLVLRHRRVDGTHSPSYVCDFATRPKGSDAVVVVLWRRRGDSVEVLLRSGLRPPVWFGRRDPGHRPLADDTDSPWMTEVVAGILERGDIGEDGIRRRAAIEAREEAGFDVCVEAFEFLGAGTFPSPGSMPEKYHLLAAKLPEDAEPGALEGDGSPMEEGASTRWAELDAAIAECVRGEILDAKTELVLRRLRDRLSDSWPLPPT